MFALYVHWPFCLKKCPYCDFNSHVPTVIDQDLWRDALIRDLIHYGEETKGRTLTSVFFGGGTPSLMSAKTVDAVLATAARYWTLGENIEISLEANPTSTEARRFADYKEAGINRLSLGIQSFDDQVLAELGRQHSAQEARRAIAIAQRTFARTSFDLIYATPGQTPAHWRRQLTQALALASDHLSLYQLTIESGTRFHRDGKKPAEADTAADLYDLTQEVLGAAGMPAYEISNHARPGQECRHNLVYWQGGDYVGIGPGAHGRLQVADKTLATHQIHGPEAWLTAISRCGHGTAKRRKLSARDRAEELLILGLRLSHGIDLAALEEETKVALLDHIDTTQLQLLKTHDFMDTTDNHLIATEAGRARLNALIGKLIA